MLGMALRKRKHDAVRVLPAPGSSRQHSRKQMDLRSMLGMQPAPTVMMVDGCDRPQTLAPHALDPPPSSAAPHVTDTVAAAEWYAPSASTLVILMCKHLPCTTYSPAPTLNDEQSRAVFADVHKPLLIVAGAGSGKTTVVVERIFHMVTQQVRCLRAQPCQRLPSW